MNPPFHLDKKLNKEYKKDFYDFDFIKRSYAMLELNGTIVGITGIKYKEFPEIVKWYEEKGAIIKEFRSEWKGENLKKGASIKQLKYCFIKLTKTMDNIDENQQLLRDTYSEKEELQTEYKITRRW
jgi:hypothetical protein